MRTLSSIFKEPKRGRPEVYSKHQAQLPQMVDVDIKRYTFTTRIDNKWSRFVLYEG